MEEQSKRGSLAKRFLDRLNDVVLALDYNQIDAQAAQIAALQKDLIQLNCRLDRIECK